MSNRAGIYLRQSLDKDGTELAIERQLAVCQEYAGRRGYEVTEIIRDNNRSASSGERPGFAKLLDMMERKAIDVVIVLRLDRLLRRTIELEWLIDLSQRTGVAINTADGLLDLTNSTGIMQARISATFARFEVEVKSERHRLANQQKAEAGKPHGSRRPYGYQANQLMLDDDEARVLREMAQRFIRGESYRDIAYWANEAGHRTTTGKLWYPVTVRNMLHRPRYQGKREYNGVMYEGQWQRVFEHKTVEKMNMRLKLRKLQNKQRPERRSYLLTGLLVCGRCGTALNGQTKRDKPERPLRRTYHCRVIGDTERKHGCGGVTRNADALEHFISECVLYRLSSPQMAKLLSKDAAADRELQQLVDKATELSQRLREANDMFATAEIDTGTFRSITTLNRGALNEVQAKIEKVTARQINANIPVGKNLAEAWAEGSDSWRRSLIDLLVDSITVLPGNTKPYYKAGDHTYRFDPRLIQIRWRA